MTEIEALRDRVEELERLLGMRQEFPHPWRLSRRQNAVLGMLMRNPLLSHSQLFESIWGGNSEIVSKVIDVTICQLRRKIKPLGIEIRNERGVGYFVPPESKRHARKLIEAYESGYDSAKDVDGSFMDAYAAVRARVAAGGP